MEDAQRCLRIYTYLARLCNSSEARFSVAPGACIRVGANSDHQAFYCTPDDDDITGNLLESRQLLSWCVYTRCTWPIGHSEVKSELTMKKEPDGQFVLKPGLSLHRLAHLG
ncbi:unnamed protein product [Protopolystoma xenopodis]|uniref:Uncharacterized protein n=1 Tax=Protopolystoma xenopodis TaxID=117903 RepID=A0A448XSN3_9PLAT|nr:unnamed protein product [Protopolystoma xenopodis]